jgi:drug/metabolite transporter (DMT)-like permease
MSYGWGKVSGVTPGTAPDKVVLRAWLPGFFALAAIWGSSFLFIKLGVGALHPLYLTLGRAGAGALTLVVVMTVLRDRLPRDVKVWLHLVVIAAFGVALPFTLFGYGEQRVPSMLAGIWNATTPLVVLPLAVLVFHTERMTARRAIGMALGFVGVLVVLGVWRGVGGAQLTGQLLCLAAASCYGFAMPYQKRFLAGRPESGLSLSAAQLLIATVQLAVVAPLVAGPPPRPDGLSLKVLASVLTLGALGTGLAFVINFRNIRLAGASTASSVTYLVPIFAVLIGVLVLRERLAWYQPVGAFVVLAGVAVAQGLFTRRPARRAAAIALVLAPQPAAVGYPMSRRPGTPHRSIAPVRHRRVRRRPFRLVGR